MAWCVAFTVAGCGGGDGAGDGGVDRGELVVGMELAYPPFETVDTRGKPTGVSVDLAHALGDYLERPVRIVNIPFDGLIPALKTGKVDLVISSMTATPERDASIDFSEPYLQTGLALLVSERSGVGSIMDLNAEDRVVAVKKGTTGHVFAREALPNARLKLLDKETVCVLEVVQGRADAFVYDQMSVLRSWRRNPWSTRALLTPVRRESWAVGLREGDAGLQAEVNAFLDAFRADGGFGRLAEKYLSDEKRAFEELGEPFVF